uniref:Uncharacterized protein n=1 Tax=Ascaris lumbricoides TaxID=6252 RepID=A0A0M3HUG8_ASCLU
MLRNSHSVAAALFSDVACLHEEPKRRFQNSAWKETCVNVRIEAKKSDRTLQRPVATLYNQGVLLNLIDVDQIAMLYKLFSRILKAKFGKTLTEGGDSNACPNRHCGAICSDLESWVQAVSSSVANACHHYRQQQMRSVEQTTVAVSVGSTLHKRITVTTVYSTHAERRRGGDAPIKKRVSLRAIICNCIDDDEVAYSLGLQNTTLQSNAKQRLG